MEDLQCEGLGRYGVVRVATFSPSDGSPPVKVAVKELTDPARALPLRIAFVCKLRCLFYDNTLTMFDYRELHER